MRCDSSTCSQSSSLSCSTSSSGCSEAPLEHSRRPRRYLEGRSHAPGRARRGPRCRGPEPHGDRALPDTPDLRHLPRLSPIAAQIGAAGQRGPVLQLNPEGGAGRAQRSGRRPSESLCQFSPNARPGRKPARRWVLTRRRSSTATRWPKSLQRVFRGADVLQSMPPHRLSPMRRPSAAIWPSSTGSTKPVRYRLSSSYRD